MLGRRIFHQALMKKCRSLAMQIQQTPAAAPAAIRLGIGLLLAHLDPRLLREFPHRIGEGQILVLAHKRNRISTLATAKTMKTLPRRIDEKRRRLLVVKRAVCLETRTRALDLDIRTDQPDDVRGAENLFDAFLWNLGHGGKRNPP